MEEKPGGFPNIGSRPLPSKKALDNARKGLAEIWDATEELHRLIMLLAAEQRDELEAGLDDWRNDYHPHADEARRNKPQE